MPTDQMDQSTIDPNQSDESQQQDPIENSPVDNQEQQVQNTEPDYRRMYLDAVQQYNQLNNRFNSLESQIQQVRTPAAAPEPELTDEDLTRFGTVPTIKKVVANAIREQLGSTLGDLQEINNTFKRDKMLQTAEAQFFQNYPHLSQYKDQLSSVTRQTINQSNLDPSIYGQVALAAIGQMVAMNAFQQPQNPQNNPAAPRMSAPPSAGKPPVGRQNAPRLSELERRGMRMNGYNPDDPKQVEEYLSIINNDEGVVMER